MPTPSTSPSETVLHVILYSPWLAPCIGAGFLLIVAVSMQISLYRRRRD